MSEPLLQLTDAQAEQVAAVRTWARERSEWEQTKKGPDGTVFPPAWPFAHVETESLIYALAWLCNKVADDLNTWQIVLDSEARERYVEQARQRAISVPRMEATL